MIQNDRAFVKLMSNIQCEAENSNITLVILLVILNVFCFFQIANRS